MNIQPFKPADGQQGRKWYCRDLVLSRKPGDDITYQEVMELLDCTLEQALCAMRDARRQLELDKQQSVRTVPGFGWVIMSASENLRETENRMKRAANCVNTSARLHLATPREELSRIEQARYDQHRAQMLTAQGIYYRRRASIIELEQQSRKLPRPPVPGELGQTS